MDLSFSRMSLTDFKSFVGGPHTLDFDAHPRGLCYVRGRNDCDTRLGSNGSGKSSLWDGLTWCLYGKTKDNLRNPDIRSWFGKSTAVVELDVVIDEDRYTITRQANPNRLRVNKKDVGQEEVESLIGLNFDTFLNTILLGQERPLFFDLDPSAKLQLFSDVLNLSRWEDRSKQASVSVTELDKELQSIERNIACSETRISQVEEQLKIGVKVRDAWKGENQAAIDKIQNELVPIEAQLEAFKIKLAEAEVEEDMVVTQHALSEKDSRAMFDELCRKGNAVSEAKTEKRSLERRISDFEKEVTELGDSDVCPTCGQSLEGTDLGAHKKELRKKIRNLNKEVAALRLDELVADQSDFKEKTQALRDSLDEEEQKIKKLRSGVENWRKRCTDAAVESRSKLDKLERLENETNPYSKQVREGERILVSLNKELKEYEENKKVVESNLRRTKYWVKGFKDIRLLVMEEVLQELEMVTTAMMQEVGLVGWHVKYDIEKETASGTVKRGLNLDIFNPDYGKSVRWKSWSGGEAQRLRIIGSLALAEVLLNHAGVVPDMEILDEPIKNMADQGVEDVCELLFDRSRNLERQIWYIDHQTIEGSMFDSVVEVVKNADRCSSISIPENG